MSPRKLTLKDRDSFNWFLNFKNHALSAYTFENIYIWRGLFDISWTLVEDYLCVFFRDKSGCFLYLPPLGQEVSRQAIAESFKIMDKYNKNKDISRIENIEEKDLAFYKNPEFKYYEKFPEYLCARNELAELKGDKFKSKRACVNYFSKNYASEYLPFSPKDGIDCLKLYDRWMKERRILYRDKLYQGMLSDGRICLKVLLGGYKKLNLLGRIVKIKGKIKAFSFGFQQNQEAFCVLYEVVDLSVKGLTQFIFREFCRELIEYKYINIMDDSGLENLKRVKLSYHPVKLIPAYIAARQ